MSSAYAKPSAEQSLPLNTSVGNADVNELVGDSDSVGANDNTFDGDSEGVIVGLRE